MNDKLSSSPKTTPMRKTILSDLEDDYDDTSSKTGDDHCDKKNNVKSDLEVESHSHQSQTDVGDGSMSFCYSILPPEKNQKVNINKEHNSCSEQPQNLSVEDSKQQLQTVETILSICLTSHDANKENNCEENCSDKLSQNGNEFELFVPAQTVSNGLEHDKHCHQPTDAKESCESRESDNEKKGVSVEECDNSHSNSCGPHSNGDGCHSNSDGPDLFNSSNSIDSKPHEGKANSKNVFDEETIQKNNISTLIFSDSDILKSAGYESCSDFSQAPCVKSDIQDPELPLFQMNNSSQNEILHCCRNDIGETNKQIDNNTIRQNGCIKEIAELKTDDDRDKTRVVLIKEMSVKTDTIETIYEPRLGKHHEQENYDEQLDGSSSKQLKQRKATVADPFSLSADEDFSPKVYKPIKRRLNQDVNDFAMHGQYCHSNGLLNIFEEQDDDDGFKSEEKKRKLVKDEQNFPVNGHRTASVAYVYSKELVEKANKLIRIEGRAGLVHSLIEVYGILPHLEIIEPRPATEGEIFGFHCSMYIDFLKSLKDCDDPSDSISAEAENYGLAYDCPLQDKVFETASLISGATITAAEALVNERTKIAVNWCGGWHHAKRDSASGFCYMNDIVLGILKLRERFDNVLYVDLDLHHGDGVEEAFYMTPKVMTVSFHKYACGFFPGSGSIDDVGSGRGRLYTVNVPLMDGINDVQFFSIFTSVMKKVRDKFSTEAVVIQCGADTLSEDPMKSFNMTHIAIAKCVCFMLTWNIPTLLLGGGGYNFPNTAKCWTFLTAMAAGKKLAVDIPEHENLLEYGPSYELTTSKGNRRDHNTHEYISKITSKIYKNLDCL